MVGDNFMFNDLINSYDKLDVSEKRKELGREIAELSIVFRKLLNDLGGGISMGDDFLEKFSDLYDNKATESEYLTNLYKEIMKIKELIGIYFNNTLINDYSED